MAGTPHDALDSVFPDRFEVAEIFSAGSASATRLVRDAKTGSTAVIKSISLPTFSTGSKLRLEHELSAFQNVSPECLAPLREIGRGSEHWHGVREFVPGSSLADRLKDSPLSV